MIRPLIMALLLCAGTGVAAAQTPDGTGGTAPGQGPAANSQNSPSVPGGAPGSLSKELNRSGGVIRPPATHDRGVVSPPNQGVSRTPIVPPPGTPGGNPNVQPK